jgi:hypothetical protein
MAGGSAVGEKRPQPKFEAAMTAKIVQFKKPVTAQKDQILAMLDSLKAMVEADKIDQFVAAFIHADGDFGTARAIQVGDYRMIGALEVLKSDLMVDILYQEEDGNG